jgi:hypothetical protein
MGEVMNLITEFRKFMAIFQVKTKPQNDLLYVARLTLLNQVYGTGATGLPATYTVSSAAQNNSLVRRSGTGTVVLSDAAANNEAVSLSQLNGRLSAAQRTAINALNAGTATAADIVNALKAS